MSVFSLRFNHINENVERLKGVSGIYSFYRVGKDGLELLYVGESGDLYKRMSHYKNGHKKCNKSLVREIQKNGGGLILNFYLGEKTAIKQMESMAIRGRIPLFNIKENPLHDTRALMSVMNDIVCSFDKALSERELKKLIREKTKRKVPFKRIDDALEDKHCNFNKVSNCSKVYHKEKRYFIKDSLLNDSGSSCKYVIRGRKKKKEVLL